MPSPWARALLSEPEPKPFIVSANSITCRACRAADTIDSRVILDGETPEDAYAAHCRSIYHEETVR